ncbi:hypothetical protein AQI88_31635 [Streptomyces cellostaticus]|uniref:Uncharacterized protein n=1 Tax=Streptomyces cellostaticus TaxID=67285 RepID=A0A101NFS5_9ACTN|nr:hypothetical protein [Streptomyces cellostaticus]KUM92473.1 hypothetical protein AQI88_31635 [Streptomyces cellostaticus]GHI09316.1 hypothetical protein Scel_76370 [Streptomyces cellostaticus]
MAHPTTDWSQLTHAYGTADDIPGLFARLDGGPGDEQVWHALWSALCHQGSVYSASFAALPLLTDIATGRAAGARDEAVALAGFVVAEADPPERFRYEDQIAELLPVAHACLAEIPANDPKEFVYHTQFLLAFEGVPFWSRELEVLLEEFEAECPQCGALTAVLVGEYLDDCEAELHPADPAGLTGIGARLHAMAVGAGQEAVAEWVARLFGRVRCPECETLFGLAESAAGAEGGRA